MKKITLTDPEQFNTIWQGWNAAPPEGAGLEHLNHVVKILDKLEGISQFTGDGVIEQRAVKEVPCDLIMEDQEFKTLYNRLDGIKWATFHSRRARDLLVLMKNAEDYSG